MIIKRKGTSLIRGDVGTILTEGCTLMFEIRRALSREIPEEAVEKAMQFIAMAAQSKDEEELMKKVHDAMGRGGESNVDRC